MTQFNLAQLESKEYSFSVKATGKDVLIISFPYSLPISIEKPISLHESVVNPSGSLTEGGYITLIAYSAPGVKKSYGNETIYLDIPSSYSDTNANKLLSQPIAKRVEDGGNGTYTAQFITDWKTGIFVIRSSNTKMDICRACATRATIGIAQL
eukprot:TRINITY_DN7187_c0_g2_i4.p1 TRINITY_DN7187_c0_g2~~TRINITY_DN7187_c0_g2_i4.p1  ORF type:complete len:153 (+),score=0.74 TRINITY_DN7187_c0_g2_i4:103-561(+)